MLTSKSNLVLVPVLLLALANSGLAQTWNGGGANNNWSTGANWSGGVAPANPIPGAGTADVIFSGSTRLTPVIDTPWNIDSLTFSATAGAFNVGGTNQLFLENAGITDNSTATETISAPIKNGVVSTTMSITTAAGGNLIIDSMDWYGVALTVSGSGNTTIVTGTDSGPTASLIKNGSGTLFLTGAEGFTNPATINAGIVNIQNATSLGTTDNGTTVNTGGQLQIQGGIAVGAEALTLNNTGVGGTGALLNISGNNSWAGAVTLGSATTIGSSTGTLTISGGVTNGGFLLTTAGAGNITLSGIVSGTGGLTQTGTGTLLLTGANTYTGATTVSAGTLQVGNGTSGSISNSSVSVVASGATMTFDEANGSTYSGNIANAGTVVGAEGSGITNTLSGNISSTGGFKQTGAGITILSGTNTYSGATLVSAGTLRIAQVSAASANSSSGTVQTGATLTFNVGGTGEFTNATTGATGIGSVISAPITFFNAGSTLGLDTTNATGTFAYAGNLGANPNGTAYGVTKFGPGTLELTAANTYTGPTTVSAGTVQVGNGTSGSISNSSASVVSSGATMAFDEANGSTYSGTIANAGTVAGVEGSGITNTLSGVISGAGVVNQAGVGTTVLSAANTYTGATTVNAGTLKVTGSVNNTTSVVVNSGGTLLFGASNAINHSATVSLAGGTISMQGLSNSSETMGALTLSGNSFIDFGTGSGNTLTFSSLSGLTTGVTLSVLDWTGNPYSPSATTDTGSLTQDRLLFTTNPGLTSTQLAQIKFYNDSGVLIGTGVDLSIGYMGTPEIAPVPEPSTILGGIGLLTLLVWRNRRQISLLANISPDSWNQQGA